MKDDVLLKHAARAIEERDKLREQVAVLAKVISDNWLVSMEEIFCQFCQELQGLSNKDKHYENCPVLLARKILEESER